MEHRPAFSRRRFLKSTAFGLGAAAFAAPAAGRALGAAERLRFGVIEQGAIWLPSWMRQLDAGFEAFHRSEERLRRLALRPSDYVRRQVRVTPYPTEPVGWIVEQSGEEVCLFSSDYPHVEGGRNPVKRFEASLEGASERVRRRFYCDNFVDLMGAGLPAEGAVE